MSYIGLRALAELAAARAKCGDSSASLGRTQCWVRSNDAARQLMTRCLVAGVNLPPLTGTSLTTDCLLAAGRVVGLCDPEEGDGGGSEGDVARGGWGSGDGGQVAFVVEGEVDSVE